MAVVTSESDVEWEDTKFLGGDIDTRKLNSSHKKFKRPRIVGKSCFLSRRLVLLIAGLVLLCVGLLVGLVIVATQKQKESQSETTGLVGAGTDEPGGTADLSTTRPTDATQRFIWDEIRLPIAIVPVDYVVNLHPNLTTERVEGNAMIDVNVRDGTDVVIVHARDMNISSASIHDDMGRDVPVEDAFFVESTQYYVMKLNQSLAAGKTARLEFHWQSKLSTSLVGFYRSKYRSKDGTTHVIATTQFEPTDARAAFPCFDEPAMKAHFNISIVYDPQKHKVQSNMPTWWNETQGDGLIRAHFMKTPRMSTYLVAFIVSDFDFVQTTTRSNITVRVWARPDFIAQTAWALYCGSLIIEYYEEFFGIPYPLPKQDLVAIPDFAAGAMENWGLITYRETDLLFDPHTSSSYNRQRVAVVIAHELAHQWFGNLVTMKWWNNLWLNEGFASYVEYIGTERVADCLLDNGKEKNCIEYNGTDKVPTGWDMHDQFFIDTIEYAYATDSLASSHPIDVVVETPDQINGVFDAISYDKGASILQMLYEFVGSQNFSKGLNSYLTAHKYNNAETSDLLGALDQVVNLEGGLNVSNVMDTWTEQIGFPVVTVTVNKAGHMTVSQQHFLLNQTSVPPPSKYNYLWSVPITYYTDDMPAGQRSVIQWLTGRSKVIQLGQSAVKWVKVNVQQTGYYRVNYTVQMWQALSVQLQQDHRVFSPRDRAGLIADAFAFSRANQLDLSIALETTQYLHNEFHYVPWTAALDDLIYIGNMLVSSPVFGQFKAFMCHQLEPVANSLGWKFNDTDTHIERRLRGELLHVGWTYDCMDQGQETMVKKAACIFHDFMHGNISVHPDLHSAVYGAGVANGGVEEWDFIWNVFQTTDVANEKRACLRALGETRQPWLLSRYLQYSIDETKIRPQDTVSVVAYVSRNPLGRQLAWNFVRTQWDALFAKYSSGSFSFGRMISYVADYFNTEFEEQEFQSFFSSRYGGSGAMEVAHAAERIRSNVKWLGDNEMLMDTWLTQFFASIDKRQTF